MDSDIQTAFETIHARFDQVDKKLGEHDERLDRLDRRFDEQGKDVRALAGLVGVIGSSLADLHGAMGDVAKQVQETNRRLDLVVPVLVQSRTEELERYGRLDDRIGEVERQIAELQQTKS